MFQMLINVLVACAMTGSVLSDAIPAPATGTQPLILPEDNGRITYRQASREDILRRAEARRVAPRAGALQPRQSATVYPTCSSGSPGYIPESGFVSFPEYSINTNSGNLLDGYFASVDSQIACVMLCETTSGCTAGYYAGGTTCYLRMGTVTGSAMVPRPGTDRVAHLRGDCASLESQINNSTIMSSCCNNPAPSTINRCTVQEYKNLGKYCLQTRLQYTSANRLASVTVGGSDINTMLKNCAAYCTNYTANGRTSSRNGCTAASYAYNVGSGPNCFIYGNSPLSMSGSDAEFTLTFIAGTCEQVAANNIPGRPSGGGCYSPQSGP